MGKSEGEEAKMVTIEELSRHVGKRVRVCGWLHNKRSSGKVRFLIVRDGTGFVQAVASDADLSGEEFELCEELPQESAVCIEGRVREDKRAPGGYEIQLSVLRMVSPSQDYPITPKEHGVSFLLDRRHLWLRSQRQWAIMRVRSTVVKALRDFMESEGFCLVDAPVFTPAACEGTTTLFETEYFGDKAYLTQSGQLYMEAAAMALRKVYCFGPAFRAERSKTKRHLIEFWMIEPEMAYCDLEGAIDLQERMVSDLVSRVLRERRPELGMLGRDTGKLEGVSRPFPRISYDEAVKLINERKSGFEWGEDFGAEDEKILSERFSTPFFVHRYPVQTKAFYMKRDPEDSRLSLSVDMLAPEGYGEIVGGGQREDDLETLEKSIEDHGLPREAFEWYLDLRRYGTVEHSGFGLGIERTIAWICGLTHVREAIPFPRLLHRLKP